MGDGGRAWNGQHNTGAGEKPGEGYLHGGDAESGGNAREKIVCLTVLTKRSPGDEGDAVFLAVIEDVVPFSVCEAVTVLNGDDGDDLAGALEVFEGDVGESDVLDFALRAEVGQAFHGGVEGDGGIGYVELVDGDAIEAEALEAALDGLAEVSGAGIVDPLSRADTLPSTLGSDDEVRGIGMEGFRDELFGDVGAVGVGSVNEVDAERDGMTESGEGGVAVVGRSPDAFAGYAHGSIAETMNREGAE